MFSIIDPQTEITVESGAVSFVVKETRDGGDHVVLFLESIEKDSGEYECRTIDFVPSVSLGDPDPSFLDIANEIMSESLGSARPNSFDVVKNRVVAGHVRSMQQLITTRVELFTKLQLCEDRWVQWRVPASEGLALRDAILAQRVGRVPVPQFSIRGYSDEEGVEAYNSLTWARMMVRIHCPTIQAAMNLDGAKEASIFRSVAGVVVADSQKYISSRSAETKDSCVML